MKLTTAALLTIAATSSSCSAFAPSTSFTASRQQRYESLPSVVARNMISTEGTPLEEAKEEAVDPYVAIGVKPEELGMGVDPKDVLKWMGSKQQLMDKFLRDNKGMDEERAEREVMKFYKDSEMVNSYIKFEQDKVLNPPDYKAEAEQTLSDPKTLATYAAWLVGGAGFGWVRKTIIEPKYESGEWEEIHITLPTLPWMEKAAENAAVNAAASVASTESATAATVASTAVETVSSTVEAIITEGSAELISALLN